MGFALSCGPPMIRDPPPFKRDPPFLKKGGVLFKKGGAFFETDPGSARFVRVILARGACVTIYAPARRQV